ncbi:unnamed protein product [Nippostrongylus brasiliensis]|uniref:FXYD domain-containing ion transport regulator n=1 Tax=Nippostrongylus brasiliensis TaxID=27835 RepID=A0A0N4XG81_NIPBR|nr:unnamed protein product [Nippostrongylus brasiliensis]
MAAVLGLVLNVSNFASTFLKREQVNVSQGQQFQIYSPPILLDEPSDVEEDHLTFLLGITILILVALGCIVAVSRLGKPRFMISYGNIANYDFMMWMPTKQNRRLVFNARLSAWHFLQASFDR